MWRICLLFSLLLPVGLLAVDSTAATGKERTLKGYRRFLYNVLILHPKLNSPLEQALLQHYFAGTGETFIISNADFKRWQQTGPLYAKADSCKQLSSKQSNYCYRQVDLNEDAYFGWGLGTITVLYNTTDAGIVSFIDYYDFNKKKKGIRSRKNELTTRLFRLLAPARARSFLVTFAADAYFIKPD